MVPSDSEGKEIVSIIFDNFMKHMKTKDSTMYISSKTSSKKILHGHTSCEMKYKITCNLISLHGIKLKHGDFTQMCPLCHDCLI
jgi:hypothetical protein